MSDKKREELKENLKKGFNRRGYEKDLLESLKKAKLSSKATKYPINKDRGGR